ncbi:MAG: tyrosine--tRNA ligase [Defluviitaleaceae bacterium]|nr:tyrosine--tRNA ligase [Defluviitaleaceae bacterium]
MNALDVLKKRGFVAQMTHESEMREAFERDQVVFYCGFDPTADSLHIGHYLALMAMAWMQKMGHVPIVLMGGGTGMVGDPDKADEMRKMMPIDEIDHNVERFVAQVKRFIDFEDGKAILLNNADWLRHLNYAAFIREYGIHFSVNRMLSADKYKTKFEGSGLNFFELNYMVMQAYDFLELKRRHGCVLQVGGSDQWSNIVAGIDLIRRVEGELAFGMTFNLLTRFDGEKMGKTLGGALWLDAGKTSPHDFYQYLRDSADSDVHKYLCMLTFLPLEEINELCAVEGAALNRAKEVLAYEVTKIVHGEEAAKKAGNRVQTVTMSKSEFGEGMTILDLLVWAKFAPSKSEARRAVQQGGASVDGEKVTDIGHVVTAHEFLLQKGKKDIVKIVVE